jgi:hypothetical protein
VKDDRDLPAYGGAGSMAGHARRASKQYKPSDGRARLTAAERQQFASENLEPTQLTPEEERELNAKVAESLKRHDIKEYFANAVRNRIGLHEAWVNGGLEGECGFFDGIARDGDPAGANERQVIAAWQEFTQIPAFAAYRYAGTDQNSPRYKLQRQILDLLWDFMTINLVNMTLAGSFAACFALLQNIDMIPAPVPTAEQLQAAERNKPAQDGNPVYINDATGEPVTYKFKDGRVVRYSKQMLDQLNSESYAKVMDIRKSPGELRENEEQRRARKAKEYRTTVVVGGFTQYDLDQMPSEKYRQILQLERNGGGKVGDRL